MLVYHAARAGPAITQQDIVANIDALVSKNYSASFMGDSAGMSLADFGYTRAGVDEGWEGCGQGWEGSQHYVNGTPVINNRWGHFRRYDRFQAQLS